MNSLVPFIAEHGKPRLRAFYDYWTEKTPGGKKMKFELQKTWEVKKRLMTWAKNEQKPGFVKTKTISKAEATLNSVNNVIEKYNVGNSSQQSLSE